MNHVTPLPEAEETNVTALVLSALVRLLLIGALFFGVQWKRQAPTAVAVEVARAARRSQGRDARTAQAGAGT